MTNGIDFREFIIQHLKRVARQLDRTPTMDEISSTGLSIHNILKVFPTWNAAVSAAGLEMNHMSTTRKSGQPKIFHRNGLMERLPKKRQ